MRVCMHGYVWVRVRCTFVCLRATVDDRWAKFCNNHSNAYAHTRQKRTPSSAREAAEYADKDKFANTSRVTANLFMVCEMVVIDSMLAKNTGRDKLETVAANKKKSVTPWNRGLARDSRRSQDWFSRQKSSDIFWRAFFWRGITAREQISRAVVLARF